MRTIDAIAADVLTAEAELAGHMARHGAARDRARETRRRGDQALAAHAQQLADTALTDAAATCERINTLAAEYDAAAQAFAERN